jgi:hypothetical protein
MRRALMAAATLAAMGAMAGAAGGAAAAPQVINLSAHVADYCLIDGAASSTSRTITVTTSNGKVATPGPLALAPAGPSKVVCTSNARIQLTTTRGGLTNGSSPADPHYTNKIHYTAKATYNGATETLTTADSTAAGFTTNGSTTVGGAQTNVDLDIAVEVLPTPDGKVLAGGTYTDTITVTLTPAT